MAHSNNAAGAVLKIVRCQRSVKLSLIFKQPLKVNSRR